MKALREHQVSNPVRSAIALPEAVLDVDREIEKDPDNAKLWMERGLGLSSVNLMREAVEAYSKAIAIEPFNGLLYRHRGHRHLSCWEFDEAVSDFSMAARLIPGNWDVWYHFGLSYYLLGEYAKASAAYRRCYALTPRDEDPEGLLFAVTDWWWRTLMRLGKKDEAQALLEALPEDFDVEKEVNGYSRNCAMYLGLIEPEDLIRGRMDPENLEATSMIYALSNYYHLIGNEERSNELIEETLLFAGKDWWPAFGYLAAMTDKNKRIKEEEK